jgi:hypothetical protein
MHDADYGGSTVRHRPAGGVSIATTLDDAVTLQQGSHFCGAGLSDKHYRDLRIRPARLRLRRFG